MTPVLAMLDLGMLVLKILAVVGGAAVGGLGSGFLTRLLAKLAFHRQVQGTVLRVIQALGGGALGLAVWLWVFGTGGGGFGWGGMSGLGGGQEAGAGAKPAASSTAKEPTAKATVPPTSGPQTLRIDMLGGPRVRDQRFYVLEGAKEAQTLGELRKTLQERQARDKDTLQSIEIVIYENSVAKDHPAVRDLDKWARDHDLAVSMSFPMREAPE